MLRRRIGTTDIVCSAIGLGTWAIGGSMWGGSDDRASLAAIGASLDAGVTLIDTAPGYGLGHAEQLVGAAIKGRRHEVVLATKCGLNWHHGKGAYFFEQQGFDIHRYLGADGITYEVEQSLRRLGTDYIDLYITHWQDATTPVEETVDALERLKGAGKIRAIGASNVSATELRRYVAAGKIDCIQERFSLVDQGLQTELLPLAERYHLSILGYSPLAMGLLTGQVPPSRVFADDDVRAADPRFSQGNRLAIATFRDALTPLLERYRVSLGQLVLAWTLRQPRIDVVLCGARDPRHALENASAGKLSLSDADLAEVGVQAKSLLAGLCS